MPRAGPATRPTGSIGWGSGAAARWLSEFIRTAERCRGRRRKRTGHTDTLTRRRLDLLVDRNHQDDRKTTPHGDGALPAAKPSTMNALNHPRQPLRHHAEASASCPRTAPFPSRHQRRPSGTLACPPTTQNLSQAPTSTSSRLQAIHRQYKRRATRRESKRARFVALACTGVTGS